MDQVVLLVAVASGAAIAMSAAVLVAWTFMTKPASLDNEIQDSNIAVL